MRIQIHTSEPMPWGGLKTTLKVDLSDTIADVINKLVKKEDIRTRGCWVGMHAPKRHPSHPDFLPLGSTLSEHNIVSGSTLEFHKGTSANGHSQPINTMKH